MLKHDSVVFDFILFSIILCYSLILLFHYLASCSHSG